ncbi:hypothetical protein H8E06_00850 [bacterium]|nr:hypothetical protein [bacterium]
MKVGICHTKRSGGAKALLKLFSQGIAAHGDETVGIKSHKHIDERLSECDVSFQICDTTQGTSPDDVLRKGIRKHQTENNKRQIIADAPLIPDPGGNKYVSIGFDGIKGSAQFHNENSPSDRRESREIDIRSWNTNGEYILIISQTFKGSGLRHLKPVDAMNYYIELPERIREYTDREIVFRCHQNQMRERMWKTKYEQDIMDAIDNITFHRTKNRKDSKHGIDEMYDAYCCITRTSAGCVGAIISGVPSISEDQFNIANPVSDRNLANIENILKPDREQWVNDLCYAEWSHDELKSGACWQHLRQHVNKNRYELAQTRQSMGLYTTSVQ